MDTPVRTLTSDDSFPGERVAVCSIGRGSKAAPGGLTQWQVAVGQQFRWTRHLSSRSLWPTGGTAGRGGPYETTIHTRPAIIRAISCRRLNSSTSTTGGRKQGWG